MKKLTFIFIVSAVIAGMTACIKAGIEKEALVIEDKVTSNVNLDVEKNNADSLSQARDDSGYTQDGQTAPADDNDAAPTVQENNNPNEAGDPDKDSDDNTETDTFITTIMLEGMEESITYKLYKSDLGFSILYDLDRFSASNTADGVLQIIAPNPDPGIYPYVYMNISRYDYSDVAAISKLENDLQDKNISLDDILADAENYYWLEVPESPDDHPHYVQLTGSDSKSLDTVRHENIAGKKAYTYSIRQGDSWNSAVRKYYFITLESYVYKIEIQYFVEAEEGYGARLNAMLSTLQFD